MKPWSKGYLFLFVSCPSWGLSVPKRNLQDFVFSWVANCLMGSHARLQRAADPRWDRIIENRVNSRQMLCCVMQSAAEVQEQPKCNPSARGPRVPAWSWPNLPWRRWSTHQLPNPGRLLFTACSTVAGCMHTKRRLENATDPHRALGGHEGLGLTRIPNKTVDSIFSSYR